MFLLLISFLIAFVPMASLAEGSRWVLLRGAFVWQVRMAYLAGAFLIAVCGLAGNQGIQGLLASLLERERLAWVLTALTWGPFYEELLKAAGVGVGLFLLRGEAAVAPAEDRRRLAIALAVAVAAGFATSETFMALMKMILRGTTEHFWQVSFVRAAGVGSMHVVCAVLPWRIAGTESKILWIGGFASAVALHLVWNVVTLAARNSLQLPILATFVYVLLLAGVMGMAVIRKKP